MYHLQALDQVIQKANEFNLELNVFYIDNEKAFDPVEHKAKVEANGGYVHQLEDINTEATAKIHIESLAFKRNA